MITAKEKNNLGKIKEYWVKGIRAIDIGKNLLMRPYSIVQLVITLSILLTLKGTELSYLQMFIFCAIGFIVLLIIGLIYLKLGLQGAEYAQRIRDDPCQYAVYCKVNEIHEKVIKK